MVADETLTPRRSGLLAMFGLRLVTSVKSTVLSPEFALQMIVVLKRIGLKQTAGA